MNEIEGVEVKVIWIDEASEMTKEEYDILNSEATGGLLNSRGIPIMWQLPYDKSWLYEKFKQKQAEKKYYKK